MRMTALKDYATLISDYNGGQSSKSKNQARRHHSWKAFDFSPMNEARVANQSRSGHQPETLASSDLIAVDTPSSHP